MKNLLLTGLIIFLGSCSNDDFDNSNLRLLPNEAISREKTADFKTGSALENFKEVPAGECAFLIPVELEEKIISILKAQSGRNGQMAFEKSSSDLAAISSAEDPVSTLLIIVDESTLESSLKIDVKRYIVFLGNLRGQQHQIVDDFIIQYEISKRQDSTLLTGEKETVLSISSISEAVLFSEKDRKDRDWETSTTRKSNRH
ncbi:hypothetical protein [Flavobacterium anhuiense]|uniref:hypothetical protein n=1 Tax=Flavobacterium anhuiense TaxID=459526 RepID=UPI003D964084